MLLCEDATCLSKFFKKVLQESNYKLKIKKKKKKVAETNLTYVSNTLLNNICNDSSFFSEEELRKKTLEEENGEHVALINFRYNFYLPDLA